MLASSSTMYDTERTEGVFAPLPGCPIGLFCTFASHSSIHPRLFSLFSLQIKRTESSPPCWFCALVW